MTEDNIKKTLSHFWKSLHFEKFYGRKSVFSQILRVKNLYILIKSVWVAGLAEDIQELYAWIDDIVARSWF